MAIYEPKVFLTKDDKRLLRVIAALLLEDLEKENKNNNVPDDCVELSDEQASELLGLLKKLSENRDFIRAEDFLDKINNLHVENEKEARSVYIAIKADRERNAVLNPHAWYELKSRLGITPHTFKRKKVFPMEDTHFLEMERRLFQRLGFKPKVVSFLMNLGEKEIEALDYLRHRDRGARKSGRPEALNKKRLKQIEKQVEKNQLILKIDLSSIAFVVSNSAVLFTTRDWTAAGVFSMMIGQALKPVKE